MSQDVVEPYIPWVREALLPGESIYALLNKLGWFSGKGPVKLMRELWPTEEKRHPIERMNYSTILKEWSRGAYTDIWPITTGSTAKYFDASNFQVPKGYARGAWEDERLRFCPECISLGMHFTISQLRFIEFCPYHQQRLISHCTVCGEQTDYCSVEFNAAFGCNSCEGSLLAGHVTDLCANKSIRWRISRAHQELSSAMDAAAPIHSIVTWPYHKQGRFPGIKEATTTMLQPNRPGSEDLSSVPRYTAIRVGLNQHGQPSVQPVSVSTRLKHQSSLHACIHRSAQLRAGAWLLQQYPDHLMCMVASREMIMRKSLARSTVLTTAKLCCIGNGFAAWESGCHYRIQEKILYSFCDAWGLKSTVERSFGSYIAEKACLTGSISIFLRNDPSELSEWLGKGLSLPLQMWRANKKKGGKPLILRQDLTHIDFSKVCESSRLDEFARWQWLSDHCAKVYKPHERLGLGRARAVSKMQQLLRDYGASRRATVSMPILHARINGANACPHYPGSR